MNRIRTMTETRLYGWRLTLGAVAVAVAALAAQASWAQPMGGGMGGHGGMGMHGPMGGMGMHGPMDGRRLDRMLDGLNATEAQRTQIRQIMDAAANDLKGQREARQQLHEKALQVFGAPTVDAAAAESLRQQMQAQHEQASKRMLQAMLDASKVLTPEQRAKMAARMKERADTMHERMQRMDRQQPPQR